MKHKTMRESLKKFISYEEGESIRKKLHEKAKAEYIPRHKDKYLEFMNENECSFEINHPQSENAPYYFSLFTVKSQWVMGDCVEACLDKAIETTVDISENLLEGFRELMPYKE